MSEIVYLNEPEIRYAELFRVALSEPDHEARLAAIRNVRFEVADIRVGQLTIDFDEHWPEDPRNAALVRWFLTSQTKRQEAAFAFSELGKRYEENYQRPMNIAEHIGHRIFEAVQDKKFTGVQTDTGILSQVREEAKSENISGARDQDTLRKIWNRYRGVVHFGMAIGYLEDNPDQNFNLLYLASLFQKVLSENCPKGTRKPYVDPKDQISFIGLSRVYGPRFLDRGLPFDVA